ncbi:taurine transport system ATP-binding protein [Sphaerotilus hippei]|uniref:Taurine transport system ATP-binding protein n=2 Tax=Sphaerotilus hippei TaxID=744406 RepID=A0A318GY90_9BURK|nr:taurine transport system ATP-binding protein [Sphaerotilus hippei]
MLELRNVGVRYTSGRGASRRQTDALSGIDLTLPAGRLLVILGPSGCGKSTLLNVIAGFVPATSGSVHLDGRQVTGPGADRGVVFQDDALLPWLDVLGNTAFALQLRGVPKAEREAQARRSLALVGLQDFEHHAVWELSGGMRQRVGIARALTADPALLLMDEPFGALDALTRERMQELLLKVWRASGKTVAVVTHGVEEAVFLATDLIVMSRSPSGISRHLALDFGHRHARGEPARSVKSDPAFIAVREEVLQLVHAQDGARPGGAATAASVVSFHPAQEA